ncbi:hypothetical protein V8C34DRAFT_310708 [Trichoderma compactum]
MENVCSFEPMWKDFEADVPQKDIARIRLKSLEVFLRENKFLDTEQPPSLEYIIATSLEITNHLLCFWQGFLAMEKHFSARSGELIGLEHLSGILTNRRRSRLTPDDCKNQFSYLAMQTGCQYPCFIPAPETATSVNHLDQEYLYNLPMVKKPISDASGNLTLPFLTTAIRALRFGEDPDEIEQNLFMMTFPLTISLPL